MTEAEAGERPRTPAKDDFKLRLRPRGHICILPQEA